MIFESIFDSVFDTIFDSVFDSIFDSGSSNSNWIHQFYYLASTQLRSPTFSIRLEDESGVGTLLRWCLESMRKTLNFVYNTCTKKWLTFYKALQKILAKIFEKLNAFVQAQTTLVDLGSTAKPFYVMWHV